MLSAGTISSFFISSLIFGADLTAVPPSAEGGTAVKSAPKISEEIKKEEIVPAESNVIKLDANKKEPKVFEENPKRNLWF